MVSTESCDSTRAAIRNDGAPLEPLKDNRLPEFKIKDLYGRDGQRQQSLSQFSKKV